ncbi:group II intron maturase-specific domain-containing protein, partial [Streptomyces microflavus]|uniref:group II intron maturase-specific domain-containing protein n=1 Tax=Streptomyces microflavus TaxID=1919 RepID=UPI0033C2D694
RIVLQRHRRSSRFLRIKQIQYQRVHHSGGGPELARWINPIVRGWMQYYGAYYRTLLHPLLQRINTYLLRWIRKKYRRLRAFKSAHACWLRITRQHPRLFAQWAWTPTFW